MIETNYGIQLPAILQSVFEMFSRDGVGKDDVNDPELKRYVNNLLAERDKGTSEDATSYSNLGRGVGTTSEIFERDDSNKDPFRLMRDKGQV